MELPITGGCLCGTVRYQITTPLEHMGFCYCRSCQKETGSSHLAWIGTHQDAFQLTGECQEYTTTGGSGHPIHRLFCSQCGSIVLGKLEVLPGFCSVAASSLDDPNLFTPQMNIWVEDAPVWAKIDKQLQTFNQNPS